MIVGSLCGFLLVGVDWFWPLVGLSVGLAAGGIDSAWEYFRLRSHRVVITETAIELWRGRTRLAAAGPGDDLRVDPDHDGPLQYISAAYNSFAVVETKGPDGLVELEVLAKGPRQCERLRADLERAQSELATREE